MKTDLKLALTRIEKGDVLTLRETQGKAIAVFSGATLLTQDSDPTGHRLGAGESFALDGRGLTIVQAFSSAQVLVFDVHTRNDLAQSSASASASTQLAEVGTSATAPLAPGDAQARLAANLERLDELFSIDWTLEVRRQRALAIGGAIGRGSAALLLHLKRLGAWLGTRVLATFERWRSRARARDELEQLDDRLLADIGVTRGQVERERRKSIWR